MEFPFQIAILIMSVVVHEVAHGYVAYMQGDPTAKYEGRLTLNPLKHLDPFGSVILPTISYLLGGFIFGWAKPVPYNPYNLRNGRRSEFAVAAAGPLSNLIVAGVFSILLRVGISGGYASNAFVEITALVVLINLLLAVFNLIPIPPLDGSKLLFTLFPEKMYGMRRFFEQFGFFLIIFVIFFAWQLIHPIIGFLFTAFTGLAV